MFCLRCMVSVCWIFLCLFWNFWRVAIISYGIFGVIGRLNKNIKWKQSKFILQDERQTWSFRYFRTCSQLYIYADSTTFNTNFPGLLWILTYCLLYWANAICHYKSLIGVFSSTSTFWVWLLVIIMIMYQIRSCFINCVAPSL